MPPPTAREWATAGGLYLLTWLSVWLTYGFFWMGRPAWQDSATAWEAFTFAAGLMTIFSAHEAGHYLVARRWGVWQSLPRFIPFPMAFGTLGAIIRLRSVPPNRSALLEIGAAGPIAGFVVALGVMALSLPETEQALRPTITVLWPLPPPPAPGLIDQVLATWPISVLVPMPGPLQTQLVVLANPLAMDVLGVALIGAPPGRYADLTALGMAGWAGCFLTAMNLLPIGQLDGGHVLHAITPRWAPVVSRSLLVLVLIGGYLWGGWIVWGVVLWKLGASRGVVLASSPPPRARARVAALGAAIALVGCFMPQPLRTEIWSYADLTLENEEGRVISEDELRAWLDSAGAELPAAQGEAE